MEMPHPTDAHRKLRALAGRWSGNETIAPSPWDPKGGTAAGMVDNREALDGLAVIQDYEQRRGDHVTFRGHGIFGYDANRQRYTLHWFDAMGVSVFEGTFEGNMLTLLATGPQGQTRAVWDFFAPGRYRNTMEVSGDGRTWTLFMEGAYTLDVV